MNETVKWLRSTGLVASVITSNLFYSCQLIHETHQDMHFSLPMPVSELTFDQLCEECLFKDGGGDVESIPLVSEVEGKKAYPTNAVDL